MKADTLDLSKLFANAVRYLVPIFQRPYVWKQGEHWEPLWEDVRLVADLTYRSQTESNRGGSQAEVAPHFLGAIVLDQVLNPTGSIESRYVIDGQQRLTTLQLFLSAAQEVATDLGLSNPATTLGRLILNPEDLIEDLPDHRFKVWPTNKDRAAFRAVMDTHGAAVEDEGFGGHRMAHAENFFHDAIKTWVSDDGDGTEEPRMKALTAVITRLLKVVVIDLEPIDNAQIIFETLNARGTRLLASDLVKNLVFQRADQPGVDLQALYDKHWSRFDEERWRAEIRQGRLNRPRVEVFLFHWLTMQTGNEVGASRLFQVFRDYLDGSDRSVVEVIGEFDADARTFLSFDEKPYGSREQRFFYRLDVMDTTTLLPVILWLYRQPPNTLNGDSRLRALRILESWLVRRMVCRMTTKNYNRLFLDLLREIKKQPQAADQVLADTLRAQEGVESQSWPSDTDFEAALVGHPLYGSISQKRVRMVLKALEDQLRADAELGEQIPAGTKFQIEHVLPQTWEENWPLPSDPPEDAEAKRDLAKHTLGNLTLVTSSLNPSMSNGAWSVKKSALDEHSLLLLNRRLLYGDPPSWDETSIKARGEQLATLAKQIWPGPEAFVATGQDEAGVGAPATADQPPVEASAAELDTAGS